MNEDNLNDLQEILTQALNELKEEAGESFSLEKVNLAELSTGTGRNSLLQLQRCERTSGSCPEMRCIG